MVPDMWVGDASRLWTRWPSMVRSVGHSHFGIHVHHSETFPFVSFKKAMESNTTSHLQFCSDMYKFYVQCEKAACRSVDHYHQDKHCKFFQLHQQPLVHFILCTKYNASFSTYVLCWKGLFDKKVSRAGSTYRFFYSLHNGSNGRDLGISTIIFLSTFNKCIHSGRKSGLKYAPNMSIN